MAIKISEAHALLRIAIQEALANATEPMNAAQINETPVVANLDVGSTAVSQSLAWMYNLDKSPFPLSRIPAGPGRYQWEYFNPEVVRLSPVPSTRGVRGGPPPPVNDVKSPEFAFNPVDFVPDEPAPPAAPADVQSTVTVPPGVKSITLNLGGVSIKIEFA